MTRVVVLGWGNASRGDDGLGPLIAGRLAAADLPGVAVVEDYQLQLEHALDLEGADLALFVDAGRGTPAPFALREVAPSADPASPFSHALSPEAVLGVFETVTRRPAPPAFALVVRGEAFDLGADLGAEAQARADAATAFAEGLLKTPEAAAWRAAASGKARADGS